MLTQSEQILLDVELIDQQESASASAITDDLLQSQQNDNFYSNDAFKDKFSAKHRVEKVKNSFNSTKEI